MALTPNRVWGFRGDGCVRGRRLAGFLVLLALLLLPAAAGRAERPFAPSHGQNRVLVLLVNFSDTNPAYSPAQFQDLFFGTHESTFRDFYRQASYGQLDHVGDVVGWLKVSKPHDYYANSNYGQGGAGSYPANADALVAEAVDLAEAAGVDFRLYDNPFDGATDGVVDTLIVVHQGRGGEMINNPKNIWSYNDALSNGGALPRTCDGVIIDQFVIVPEVSYRGDRIIEAGPLAHEYGHLLGLIDTYDKDKSSAGLGIWDFMSNGVWGGDWASPNLPVFPSAYDRFDLGWVNPVVVGGSTQGWFALPAAARAPTVLKIPANRNAPREFFLAEYRPQAGYDRNLPAPGVAVYHVDYRNLFENRDSGIGCGGPMPRVALEQADGRYDLELNTNSGDTSDLFPRPSGIAAAFHAATVPDTLNHDCRLSGFSLTGFTFAGDTAWVYARSDDFRPHSSVPWLIADSLEWVEVEGDGDRFLETGEVFQPVLTLENSGATASGLAASFESQNPFLLIGSTEQFFSDLAPGESGAEVGGPFMTVLPGYNPELPEPLLVHLSYDGGAQDVALEARLGAPEILYVDDDGGNVTERYLAPYLDDYGYYYDRWDVSAEGPPPAADLAGYPFVLWVTGNTRTPLDDAELAALESYLDGGGTLILSSAYLLVKPTAGAQNFARNYLHLSAWTDDRFALSQVRGIYSNQLSHLSQVWYNLVNFHFPEFNRTVGLYPDSLALGSFTNDRGHFTAVVYPSSPALPSVFRVVYYSYGLENMRIENLGQFLRRSFNVFDYRPGRPWAIGLTVERAQPRRVNLAVQAGGFNFSATDRYAFSGNGVTVGSSTFTNSMSVNLVVNVAWDAAPGWHDLIATTAAGDTARIPHLFKVEGAPLPNHAPDAAAGPDQTSYRNTAVTLSASASSDPDLDPLAYHWTQTAGPAVTLSPSDSAAAVAFNSGAQLVTYKFELTVSDPFLSDSDSVVVTIQNRAPVAHAGADQDGWRPDVFSLDGRSSSDPDGDPLTARWVQTAGPAVAVLPSDTAILAGFIPDPAWVGDYRFRLEVSDPWVAAADTVKIAVANRLPVAVAGPDQRVASNTWVTLDGSASFDLDGDTLSYQWSQDAGPAVTLDLAAPVRPRFLITEPGNYHFSLRCADPFGLSPADGTSVAINLPPLAEAGPGSEGHRGQRMTLDGSLSSDPNGDPIALWWEQLSGPPVALVPGNTATITGFTADYLGDYVFRLNVTDSALSDSDTVTVSIRNRPPVARAGDDLSGLRSELFLLNGDSSFDPDGDPLVAAWVQTAGPAVTVLPSDTAEAAFFTPAPDWVGRYVFELQVSDPWDLDSDTVAVTVVNRPPTARAGADVLTILGETVTLDGDSSSDPDGDPLEYLWQQLAGPTVTLDHADPARPTFHAAATGNYLFALRADDSFEVSAADTVAVVILSRWNHRPTASAGPDQTLEWVNFAPVQLDGSGSSDPDHDPLVYNWTMVSRPPRSSAILSDPSSPTPTFNHDYLGTYVLQLTVSDGEIWSLPDEMTVLTTGNTIDTDHDGTPDCLDSDDDNDTLTDTWESAHGLNPLSAADADPLALNSTTDPDGDGNGNIHEYYNGSDPQVADGVNCAARIGACFFGDSNGDFYYGAADISAYISKMKSMQNNFSRVYPHNGDTFDLNADGYIGTADLSILIAMTKGIKFPDGGGPARAEMVSPGYTVTAAAGSTVALTLRVVSDGGQPRSGLAVVFELLSGSGQFLGGEGQLPGNRTWSDPGNVNTTANESAFALSRDELEMIVASNRSGDKSDYDFYSARRAKTSLVFDNFTPVSEINTPYSETTPALSANRLELFFARYVSSWDIYRTTRGDLDSAWDTPQPVTEINTAALESAPSITDDGLTLYFVRYVSANPGHQLYRARRLTTSSPFGTLEPVTELNTSYTENLPNISGDDTRIYFMSNRSASATDYNIWYADRPNPSVPFSTPVPLSYVNTGLGDLQAWESPDRKRLYLTTYGHHASSDINLYLIKRPTPDLPYWISARTARYDVTGEMTEGGTQDSGGRVRMVFAPSGCGTFDIAAYGDEDVLQQVPTFSAAGLVRVLVPCP